VKIVEIGDAHLRPNAPRSRKDNYVEAQRRKMRQVIEYCQQWNAILNIPGDLFDFAVKNQEITPYWLVNLYIREFAVLQGRIAAILGQHDQRYHSNATDNTPIVTLQEAGVLTILGSAPKVFGDPQFHFYGAGWNEDIPEIQNPRVTNILLTHRMVIKEELWVGQQDDMETTKGNVLLRKLAYDLIVCGDNHQFFTETIGDRHLVNCGSVMRANSDQKEHIPAFVVYDTETRQIEVHPFDIAPADEVFNEERVLQPFERPIQSSEQDNKKLDTYVEKLKGRGDIEELDFFLNLDKLMGERNTPENVRRAVHRITEKHHGNSPSSHSLRPAGSADVGADRSGSGQDETTSRAGPKGPDGHGSPPKRLARITPLGVRSTDS
jgi:predicted phosphodiesterase